MGKYPASRLKGLAKLKGKTYEEVFGLKKAAAIKEKMRQAKLGKKMPWNKGYKGENHPRWIKDRTKVKRIEQRNSPEYKQWRAAIWLRDNWTCRINNPNCNGRIEVHHILGFTAYPDLRFNINNGITLCHAHHPRKRAEEKLLVPVFQKLVMNHL